VSSSVSRLAALDLLRGVAAAMVFFCHFQLTTGADLGPLTPFAVGSGVGLGIFFVLSGYLLYRPFVGPRPDLGGYAVRRLFRIVPAYVFALVGVSLLTGQRLLLEHPLTFLLTAQVYVPELRGHLIAPSWTLTLELLFYASLPVWAAAIERLARGNPTRRVRAVLWLAMGSLIGHFLLALALASVTTDPTALVLVEVFPFPLWMFAPGMLVAAIEIGQPERFGRLRSPVALVAGVALILVGVMAHVRIFDVITALGGALVIGHVVARAPAPGRWTPAAVACGGLSYGIYLWHWDILRILGEAALAPSVVLAIAVPATVVAAWVSWRFVEQPAIAFARHVAGGGPWLAPLASLARWRPRLRPEIAD